MLWLLSLLRDAIFGLLVLVALSVAAREGLAGLARRAVGVLKLLPGVEALIASVLRREVRGFMRQLERDAGREPKADGQKNTMPIPEKGLTKQQLLQELRQRKERETDPHSGKIFAYVYTSEDEKFKSVQTAFDMFEFGVDAEEGGEGDGEGGGEGGGDGEGDGEGGGEGGGEGERGVEGEGEREREGECQTRESKAALIQMFFHAFMHENALNPMVFPSLCRFETEIVAMVANMLHGDSAVVGSVTSGGTESILMAVKTYRDRAKALFPQITEPEMVAPLTIHPAFEKAASYFNVKVVHVPLKSDLTPDMDAYEKAISPSTILLLCSAPEYCYGMVDPVSLIARLASERSLPLHVDACFGGFMLPWVERLGYAVPVFDFRLPGVTSMSADIHKYGLGIKGSSVVLYRDSSLRKYQIFAYAEWPGGLFGSPTMAGTRPGGNIASSWAVLQVMGEDGYTAVAERLMKVTQAMRDGIGKITGLEVCGRPAMTAFSVSSSDGKLSIFAVADEMEKRGWNMERQQGSLHFSILPSHTLQSAQQLLDSLRDAVATVKANPSLASRGSAGVYGMVGVIPDKAVVKDFVVEFFNEIYTL